jgi:hypothetical protein
MPVLKTVTRPDNSRSVIVKTSNGDKRPTCTCCEDEECCMYAANALADEVFGFDDLPATVFLNNGSPIQLFKNVVTVGSRQIVYGQFNNGAGPCVELAATWRALNNGSAGLGNCLFRFLPPDPLKPWLSDDFALSYTVAYSEAEDLGTVQVTVERQSLCVWESEIFNIAESTTRRIRLRYQDGKFPQNPHKWIIENGFLLWVKQGPLNNPIGTYVNPGSSIPDLTVSA